MTSLWRHSRPTYHRCEFSFGQHGGRIDVGRGSRKFRSPTPFRFWAMLGNVEGGGGVSAPPPAGRRIKSLFYHSLTELKWNTLTLKAGPLPGHTKVTWLSKISWRTILSAEAGPHHPRPYFTPQCKMWAKLEMILFFWCPWHWRAGLWILDWFRLSIVSLMWFTFLFIVLWNVLGCSR